MSGPSGTVGSGGSDGAAGADREGPTGSLARLFLKLGLVAFGGPAAHIAMMEEEVVTRRGWLDRQRFLDLVGATNLIPGPNSTEMAMHVGFLRGGFPGLLVAGSSFIGPAVLITGGLAFLYARYGTVPAAEPFLFGIKPAVIAVILGALWRLGGTAVKGIRHAGVGLAVVGAVLLGMNEVVALLGGGAAGGVLLLATGGSAPPGGSAPSRGSAPRSGDPGDGAGSDGETSRPPGGPADARPPDAGGDPPATASGFAGVGGGLLSALPAQAGAAAAGGVSLWKLGLFFLKVGAVLYGSGYVLVAFLEGDLVEGYGWLARDQLLDAIAIGQFTPGPVLSTATFIGYLLAGVPGAAVATLGIFLPSFLFVALLNPVVPRLRDHPATAAFLDAVNVAAVGLMAAVTLELGRATLLSPAAWAVFAGAAALALLRKVGPAWIVLGGAAAGWVLRGGWS